MGDVEGVVSDRNDPRGFEAHRRKRCLNDDRPFADENGHFLRTLLGQRDEQGPLCGRDQSQIQCVLGKREDGAERG